MLPPVRTPRRSASSGVLAPLVAAATGGLSPRTAEVREMSVLSIGCGIDNFTITSLLGTGANGAVFGGVCTIPEHPFPGKSYALKVMYVYGGSTSSTATRNHFEAEFKLLGRLERHPRSAKQFLPGYSCLAFAPFFCGLYIIDEMLLIEWFISSCRLHQSKYTLCVLCAYEDFR